MKITLYKGLGFAHDTIEVEEGKPLCQSLPDIDFNHAAVVVNAVKSDGFYKPKEGDGVMVRLLPQGSVAALVIGIVSITLTVAAGIAAGVIAYKQKQELEKQKRELEKLKSQTNNDAATNLPFLKGATNSLATGKSQPYLMGRNFFTPYLLTRKWYTLEGVDGKTQFVTQVFECGFGKQVFEKVQADDILIKTFDKSLGPQEGCSDLIDDSESGGFSAGGKIDIVQSDGLFAGLTEANVRVASDTPQAEIPRAADISAGKKDKLVYSLDPNAKNVHIGITFGSGLYYMNPNTGGKQNKSVIITPSYSLDGGTTWIPFSFNQQSVIGYEVDYYDTVRFYEEAYDANRMISQYQSMGYSVISKDQDFLHGQMAYHVTMRKHIQEKPIYGLTPGNTFTRNTIDEIRFEAVREFTLSDYERLHLNEQAQILIQVVNETAYDSNSRDTAHLLYYQSQCFDPDKSETPAGTMSEEDYEEAYPEGTGLEDCEVVSLKVRSLSTMMAVRLKASQSNESKMGKINFVSNSLAKVCEDGEWSEEKEITANPAALLVEVLQSHTHPLSAFDDDELDLDAFADLYDFCETEEIRFNAVATQKNTKQKLLEQICSVCRATLYWNAEGKLSVAWDCAQDTIVAALDSDSIIDVENEKEFARPVDAIRATWLDESDWKQKSYTILNNGVTELDADSVIKDLNITGLTTFDQVAKFVRYTMACMNIRQKTVNVKVGNEGVCFSPCTRVTVKDDSLGDTPQNLLITSATSNGNGWTLKCVDYDARVYNPGDIPEYKSSIEQLSRPASGLPSIYVTAGEFDEYKAALNEGTAFAGKPDTPTIGSAKAVRDGINIKCLPIGNGVKNDIATVFWQVAKTSGTPEASDWMDLPSTAVLETSYTFNRATDGYPEREDLYGTTVWRFRARILNAYGKYSEWSDPAAVDVSSYGTWQVGVPIVNTRISDRTITLMMGQPARGDNREIYGTVRYQVQVKRHDDADWYKPATNLNPYPQEDSSGAIVQGNEDNYKDGSGYVISDSKWIQTMPLKGQSSKNIQDTLYIFRIKAFNEAGASEWTDGINASALCTNIRDIVQANETAKQAYIKELSAISANIGTITQGSFGGNQNNLWDLSTFTDSQGGQHWEGKMRVGGREQYLAVDPILDGGEIIDYKITFKVGNFEITSTASNINGELVIQSDAEALDRTRITPNGTYYEHRDDANSPWRVLASNNINGVNSKQLFSEDTLYITNQDMAQRRKEGMDIGTPYLSNASKVFHFDTDVFDQDGNDTLTIADAEDGGHSLVNQDQNTDGLDFTPAILAVAPYATMGKSLYGQYSVQAAFAACVAFTVDFWIQYIFAENQVIFDVGNSADSVKLVVASAEPFFEQGTEGDEIPFNEEILFYPEFLYRRLGFNAVTFNKDDELLFAAAQISEIPFEETAAKPYKASYVYYEHNGTSYETVDVTAETYHGLLESGLYELSVPFNSPDEARSYLRHGDDPIVELVSRDVNFKPNSWLHIAIAADSEKMCVYLNDKTEPVCFVRSASASLPLYVKLNEGKNSFCLDELMVDNTVKEPLATFLENTAKRKPWAKLTDEDDYFVLTAKDPDKVKTNLFDSDLFKAKVLEIIQEYHS